MQTYLPFQDSLTIYFALATVLLPLLAFAINCSLPGKGNKIAAWVSTSAIFVSCILAVIVFLRVWNHHTIHLQQLWFTIGNSRMYAGILLNNLSVLMLVLVTFIALPVHIYSTAYMKHDERYKRYFTYLSFFCFSMLALVVADNLVLFYAFWELVGFSSYLLIGFWFTRQKAIQANKKAFLMNRIGDVGLLIAILIIFAQYRSLDLVQLFGDGGFVSRSIIKNDLWVGPLKSIPAVWQYAAFGGVFLAVAAKSAQFPLHTWLPDAMEGPTSVSALIHAATMVAAGVFLLGRVYMLFTTSELDVLAIIGCFTAFMAATIALTQNDIKKALAYSTISQLGYMVMSMGTGAYASSLFHLVTHAFFKCLLFLVAGIVIHEVNHVKEANNLDIDPQNIANMGGLRKRLPFTFIAAIIGSLALIGLPLTSGYLSKDGILIQAFEWSANKSFLFKLVPIGAVLTTLFTAFYVVRLMVKVFFGRFNLEQDYPNLTVHMSDSGWPYKFPLVLLALACFFPLFALNPFSYENAWIFNGLKSAGYAEQTNLYHLVIPIGMPLLSLFVMYFAYTIYTKPKAFRFPQTGFLFRLSYHQWYMDDFYAVFVIKPVLAVSKVLNWFDKHIIDGFINLMPKMALIIAKIAAWFDYYIIDGFTRLLTFIVAIIGNFARRFQGGKVQYYIYSMLVIILAIFIYLGWR